MKALRARVVIVGDNFRFGHEQAGDVERAGATGRALRIRDARGAPR